MGAPPGEPSCCSGGQCTPPPRLDRRAFLATSGSALVALSAGRGFAGPFGGQDGFPVPADKKLDPAWVRSLFARGEPEVVSGEDLRFIGMPVGGLFAGTVYLGGDGRLWNWDVFNEHHEGAVARTGVSYRGQALRERDGANYAAPPEPRSPFDFGVALLVAGEPRPLDRRGWSSVRFRGEYPVGTVSYTDPDSPLEARLEAFSPFVPLDVEASSHPATVLRYTLTNAADEAVPAAVVARFENPVLLASRAAQPACEVLTEDRSAGGVATVLCSARVREDGTGDARPDLPFEDFESGTYEGWQTEGTAFGSRPRHVSDIAAYQGDLGAQGEHLVNSHETRGGEDVAAGDRHTGTLTSRPFRLERRHVNFRIGGGAHEGRTCLDLLVDGEVVRTATGRNANAMRGASFDVSDLEGREARLQVVDAESGPWGNVGVDDIVFSDVPRRETEPEALPDFGSFCVSCPGEGGFTRVADRAAEVGRRVLVPPGGSATVTLVVAWHFPNLQIPGLPGRRRWYASRWPDALAVARSLAARLDELTELTLRWRDTWYDSTLPYWLLDRTLIPIDALATNTCHRFEDGRYWFWEGIGCCAGTCTHVWGYAQAIGRLFPAVERALREEIDYGLAFHADTGAIDYRAEFGRHVAHDGQCGCVLRAYREHLMSADGAFLGRLWPRVRRSIERLIAEDGDEDGLLEGAQYNTLDAAWYGPMAWLSSLYVAALSAGAAMARAVGDGDFAGRCEELAALGSRGLVTELFNGEYFVHRPDPEHPEANATGEGCHIDQLYGQAWAHQVGLGRLVPDEEARQALRALWTYNFAPDVGVYRDWMEVVRGGRWYALHGEGGLLMCTFPRGGAERATGAGQSAWAAMYMNECMTGFEYQAAAHMLWEGLALEGLAVTRAIHDRYAPARRNPYNEIECSDHYGRAMAAYGVFLAACGWEYDGPRGALAFAPRLDPEDFRAAFTAAEGWGTLEQRRDGDRQRSGLHLRYGRLVVREVAFDLAEDGGLVRVVAAVARRSGEREGLSAESSRAGPRCRVRLTEPLVLGAGDRLEIQAGRA